MRNLAIIPARSGSKGLPDKNIKELNGKPLMAYTIESAKESHIFERIMVSTDSEIYATIAKKYGAEIPFLRSEEMSSDSASSWDTVIEVLENYKKLGLVFDTICLLQPTSPLRQVDDIQGAYKLFEEKHANAITSVCPVDHSPIWCMMLDDSLSLKRFRDEIINMGNRQTLPAYYRLNGAIYIKRVEYDEESIRLLDDNEYAYVMDKNRSVDIDDAFDFLIATTILRSKE